MSYPVDPLIIYPAIDLKNGQGVRLLHGRFDKITVYAPDPAAQARDFVAAGCEWIHVVDLDGALDGETSNRQAVRDILLASGFNKVRTELDYSQRERVTLGQRPYG